MKTQTAVLALVLCFVGSVVCFAKDPNLGTWKLNEANSRWSPGAPTNRTVVYESSHGDVKVTVDGTDAGGNPIHNEWSGKFDGKDYPVSGDSTSDTRAYKKIDDLDQSNCAKLNFCTVEFTGKKNGRVTMSGCSDASWRSSGERPARENCPVVSVVISGGGAGDQTVESPEVQVPVGWVEA